MSYSASSRLVIFPRTSKRLTEYIAVKSSWVQPPTVVSPVTESVTWLSIGAGEIGDGVALSDAARPIFWYRPDQSESYHAIYADMTIGELTADEVKGFEGR